MIGIPVTLFAAASLAAIAAMSAADVSNSAQPANIAAAAAPAAGTTGMQPIAELHGPYPVRKVIDGDTIIVTTENGDQKVRFIGVNTPETKHPTKGQECFGAQASAFTQNLLSDTNVYLEYDNTQGRTDAYDRLLAYPWTENKENVGQLLLAGGYATEYTYRTEYAHSDTYHATQGAAVNQQVGLWGQCRNLGN